MCSSGRLTCSCLRFEEKKAGPAAGVFPLGLDVIPAFSVIEVVMSAGSLKSFEDGFGVNVSRVRPCPFSLYSMLGPLGLELLPASYALSVAAAEAGVELNPGLAKVLETRNTGFFGRIAKGSYVTKYNDDNYRLVGPKEDPGDPMSRHLNVLDNDQGGGVFAITVSKRDLLHFTNAVEPDDEENALACAQFLVDLAASAGALSCYVIHNEFLMRKVRPFFSCYTPASLTLAAGSQRHRVRRRPARRHPSAAGGGHALGADRAAAPGPLPAPLPDGEHGPPVRDHRLRVRRQQQRRGGRLAPAVPGPRPRVGERARPLRLPPVLWRCDR
jgi:hypothetical protein